MDVWEFVQRSEWPVLIGGVLWYFRKPLTRVIDHLRPTKVSGFGLSAEFAIKEAEELTEETRAALASDKSLEQVLARSLRSIAIEPPNVVVTSAWFALEEAFVRATGLDKPRPDWLTARAIVEKGTALGLTPNELAAMNELRTFTIPLIHGQETTVTPDTAQRFANVAHDLTTRIMILAKNRSENRE